ncbi:MAG: hypothetical protein LBR84_09690 [Tannerella sp.]|jgi:ribosomal protein S17E|nr:hypothetical protein [Tannerella sp.]
MKRINKESITEILSMKEARRGLHISVIAKHLINKYSDLFTETPPLEYEKVRAKVNRILLADVKRKRGSVFAKVKNPKIKRYKRGFYKIKNANLYPNFLFLFPNL